jgi:hypothetical protein
MTTIALAIPHTPWRPERVVSMGRLRAQLGLNSHMAPIATSRNLLQATEWTERAENRVWSANMWRWLLETQADWCLSLQDDVLVPSHFWSSLDALLAGAPEEAEVIGLSNVHPISVEIGRQGKRWYRTAGSPWLGLVGWAYILRRFALSEFLAWREQNPADVARLTEDSLLNHWMHVTNRTPFFPVPTIVDHDTAVESTYGNDKHSHRRPFVTWHDYGPERLADPEFWRPSGEIPVLPAPSPQHCWMCLQEPSAVGSHVTGASICRGCLAQMVTAALGVRLQ